jgi:hypothetical protein
LQKHAKKPPSKICSVSRALCNERNDDLTTGVQFLREAKKYGLVKNLADRGFKHLKGLYFYRLHGENIHQLISGGASYGENLTFSITCIVDELDSKYVDNFPLNVRMLCGGGFGDEYFTPELWEIGMLDNCEEISQSIITVFDGYPSKWFNSINTRAKFVEALYPHIREKYEENGAINKVLTGWPKNA